MSNFSTREFERSHGKAPRGRGFWGFRLTTWGVTDVSAVLEADFLVVLLPGGRGTHTEMGVALGVGKQVYLVGTDLELATDPVAFYHHPRVTRVVANDSNRNEAMHHVLAYDEAYGLLPAPVVIKPHTQAAR